MSKFKCLKSGYQFVGIILFVLNGLSLHAQSIPSDQIQVSIRSALDKMYDFQQDSFSTIPTIIQEGYEFSVTLTNPISYDTFPNLLHAELTSRQISTSYNVQISKCGGDSIILAYDRLSFVNASAPCQGRHAVAECQVLRVIFREEDRTSVAVPLILSFTILSLGLIGFIYIKKKESSKSEPSTNSISPSKTRSYTLGNSTFIVENQTIKINGKEKSLTHRECKLLEYFAKHPNLILKRDDITDVVWKEDGIITGRSLDVFVSRLRKIMSDDKRIQIKSIHGVGYKLEIIQS